LYVFCSPILFFFFFFQSHFLDHAWGVSGAVGKVKLSIEIRLLPAPSSVLNGTVVAFFSRVV
jgi:hypothetical protein